MRSITVVLVILAVVAGVAVTGSRAQPLSATSVAFQQCAPGGPVVTDRCRPIVKDGPAPMWFDYASRDDPDWHWGKLLIDLFQAAAGWFAEHYGGYGPDAAGSLDTSLFDPD